MRLTDVITLAAQHAVERFTQKRAGVALPLAVGAMLPGIAERAIERSRSTEQKLEGATGKPFKTAALPMQLALPLAQMAQSWGKNVGGPLKNQAAGLAPGSTAANAGGALMGALGSNLGQIAGAPGKGIAGGLSDMVQKKLFGQEIGERRDAAGMVGSSALSSIGSGLGSMAMAPGKGVAEGLGDMLQKKIFGQDLGERQDATGIAGTAALKSFSAEVGKASVGLLRDIANKAMDAVSHAGDQAAREAILGELKRTDSVLAQADDRLLMESYHTMQRFAPTLSTDKNAVRSFLRQAVMSGSGPDFMTIKHLADSERAVTGGGEKRGNFLVPTAIGAGIGALTSEDDRLSGALKGGLIGGGVGLAAKGLRHALVPGTAARAPLPTATPHIADSAAAKAVHALPRDEDILRGFGIEAPTLPMDEATRLKLNAFRRPTCGEGNPS